MSQPPQQGFGAPYEPQPGVYGDPGQPQPGSYGYPPQPPTVPNGRHQPQPPAPPSGGRSRGRLVGLVAAVLAGVLVVGAGVWFVAGGDDGSDDKKPVAKESTAPKQPGAESNRKKTPAAEAAEINKGRKEGEAKVRWIQKNGVDLPLGAAALGPWITGGIVAKAMYRTVSGYSLEDGSQKWSLRLPTDVCAAPTRPTADGKIVIGLLTDTSANAEENCDKLQMIDLATGEAVWSKTIDRAVNSDLLRYVVMAISGDVMTIGGLGRAEAYRVSDGKPLWGKLPGSCAVNGFAGGSVLLASVSCPSQTEDGFHDEVRRIDPVTGRTLWTYKVRKGWNVDAFHSVDPPVIFLRKGPLVGGTSAIAVLNDDGTFRSQPAPGGDALEGRCPGKERELGWNLDICMGVAADTDTLYVATKPRPQGRSFTNDVVAFDMSTGKKKWKVSSPATQTLMPLRVEDGKVLMYLSPPGPKTKDVGGGLMALGPQGGTPQPVLRHPASAAATERAFEEAIVLHTDGRSLLMLPQVSGETEEEELELRTMIAFGD
ncbi:PQQ-binding-like beta-propeller repeat protein [Streptomyces griseus]|uniref:outer membrane protein assembly factor BamB family protein n=1 Tax=Streptomyces griseus TaxID=1911 RepID=UPI0004CBC2BC|nr:PQQ-binding-like beta-propeller repeat protein [Streptomyces griseus]